MKANLINSAVDMLDENNSGVNNNQHPIPNIHEGWGRIDLFAAVQAHEFVESTTGLGTGSQQSFTYVVAGGGPLKVTVAWSDAPSTTSASRNLVNDLDLVVTAPGGSVYRGNVFSGGWSQAGGSADRVNNVENVYVASAAAGTWTVQVTGFNVPNGPQPFALVVRGASADGGGGGTPPNTAPTAANLSVSTNEDTPLAITLSGSDAEQCELQFSITSGPANGSLSAIVNAGCASGSPNTDTAQVTYTPQADFHGSDTFTYSVSDGSLTAGATVTITVHPVNDAPVAQNVSVSTVVGTPVEVTLRATDLETCDLTFAIVEPPSAGSVSGITDQACTAGSPHTDTALVTYTPAGAGTYNFTYRASDGQADSNTATVTIAVTDLPGDATSVHVGNLDGSAVNLGRGYWQSTVTIAVHDNNHSPIAGAQVSGSWSGSFSAGGSCTTNGSGRCTVTTGQIHNSNQTVTWTVTDVTTDSLPYASDGNHDPDGDSNGTTITVRR